MRAIEFGFPSVRGTKPVSRKEPTVKTQEQGEYPLFYAAVVIVPQLVLIVLYEENKLEVSQDRKLITNCKHDKKVSLFCPTN